MEKPRIAVKPPSEESSPPHTDRQLPESSTATATSTPTMGPPRCRDYCANDGESEPVHLQRKRQAHFEDDVRDAEKTGVRQRASVGSFDSVHIADQMTVPPAEQVHSESVTPAP